MQKQRASKKELDDIYKRISDDRKSEATLIYNELSFILETIDTLKDEIREKGATEHFINGKQDFLRESPSLASYNKMMKTYDIFYKNLINLLETREQPQTNKNIMTKEDFSFEMFLNDDYDINDRITKNKAYIVASEDEKQIVYDELLDNEYNEYVKNPLNYLLAHKSN